MKEVREWSHDSTEALRACFECTDWNVLTDASTIDMATEVVTDYVKFCEDMIIPKRKIRIFPNSKPWVSKDIRDLLRRKQLAFKTGDLVEKRKLQNELSQHIRQSKKEYGKKLEGKFRQGDPKSAWQGMKTITGCGKQTNPVVPSGDVATFLGELNNFYARFDSSDFSSMNRDLRETLVNHVTADEKIILDITAVEKSLKGLKTGKSAGPDGLYGKVLKSCFRELSPVFRDLFQWSLDTFTIPQLWKTADLIPVAKHSKPIVFNDYRPVALTAIAMKCFERIVKELIVNQTKLFIDPLQFAYRAGRSVEDAVLTLLHGIYS